MRFARLDLIRYGCFTDRALEFRAAAADLQLVYGPNEAGKSTALAAIEDLLFGFPKTTLYSFQHGYGDLRIGAVVENSGETLAFRRRKGIKDTILDIESQPLPDTVLLAYLGGADRKFFERMFSLDHQRLREGGQAILDAKDEVGRTLFAAGAGISGLGEELRKLDQEADGIWAPRKSGSRVYYKRLELFEHSSKALRESVVHARDWREARTRLEKLIAEQEAASRGHREKTATRERIERIRRVLGHVREWKRLRTEIEDLGSVPELPEQASSIVSQAEMDRAAAESKIESLTGQVDEIRKQLEGIRPDETLLERETDIASLEELRAVVAKEQLDLPKQQAELKANKEKLFSLLPEIGWQANSMADVRKLIPPRTKLAGLRSVLEQKAAIEQRIEAAERNVRQQRDELETLEAALVKIGKAADAGELTAAIRYGRNKGDLHSVLLEARETAARSGEDLAAELDALRPWAGEAAALSSMPVPERPRVEEFEQRFENLEKRLAETRRDAETAERELAEQQLDREQIIRDDRAVPPELLSQARSRRDLGWKIIRRRYIEQQAIDPGMLDDFERAVQDADDLADRRFEGAKAAARLAGIDRKIERLKQRRVGLSTQQAELLDEQRALQQEWAALWRPVGIEPSTPAEMLLWLEHRDAALARAKETDQFETKTVRLADEEAAVKESLLAAMSSLHADREVLSPKPLALLLEEADILERRLRDSAAHRKSLAGQIQKAQEALKLGEREIEEARKAVEQWRQRFETAVRAAGLDPAMPVEEIRTGLDVIEEIGSLEKKIYDTQTERIDTMNRDIEQFRKRVAAVIDAVAPELGEIDASKAVVELNRRLKVENDQQTSKSMLTKELARRQKQLHREQEKRDEALARVKPLLEEAQVTDWPALKTVITQVERWRSLQTELSETLKTLRQIGDGKSPEELERECESADPDHLKAELDTLSQELSGINDHLQDIAVRKTEAQAAVDRISGSADAAAAAADRQQALAGMREAAERYIRVGTAARLLRWAVERYRKEKQAPLLRRAGEHFRTLTLGEFAALTVDYDQDDKTHLAGVRGGGEHVGVDALSAGTVDQLYLALRIAAVGEYLEHGVALPFIADDLFINYDDNRAAAGFRLLAEFARKTQVLFFTHHQHLMEIAAANCPSAPPPVLIDR